MPPKKVSLIVIYFQIFHKLQQFHEKSKFGDDEQRAILENKLEREIEAKFSIFNRIYEETQKTAIVCYQNSKKCISSNENN